MEFLDGLKDLIIGNYKIYLAFAIVGSVIFTIQSILFFFGVGDMSDADADVDIDGDGVADFAEGGTSFIGDFKIFSLRAIVAFITFFGWGGVIAHKQGYSEWAVFASGIACGLTMMLIVAAVFYVMLKMQHSGNIEAKDIIGCTGTVYMKIPKGRTANGKVTVVLNGCTKEITAVADEDIPRGASVKVKEKIDGKRFLVEGV